MQTWTTLTMVCVCGEHISYSGPQAPASLVCKCGNELLKPKEPVKLPAKKKKAKE